MEPSERSALERALLDHQGWLRDLAAKLIADGAGSDGSRSDVQGAEDLVQDVWTESLRRPPRFHGNSARMRAWLGGVARHLTFARARREAARLRRERIAARPEEDHSARALAERLRLHRRLVDEVLALEEPFRATLILHHFDGCSAREISNKQGVSAELVRQRLHRGHRRLRTRLQDEWEVGREELSVRLLPLAAHPWKVSASGGVLLHRLGGHLPVILGLGLLLIAAAVGLGLGVFGGALGVRGVDVTLADTTANGADGAPSAGEVPDGALHDRGAPRRSVQGPDPLELELRMGEPSNPEGTEGQALGEARVTLFSDHRILAELRSDAEGRCAWEGRDPGGWVLVEAPGFAPLCQRLDGFRGRRVLAFEDGRSFEGRVFVDGAPATESFEFQVDFGVAPGWYQELPLGARRRFKVPGGEFGMTLDSEATGRLALDALPPGVPMGLRCPPGFRFAPTTRTDIGSASDPGWQFQPDPLAYLPVRVVRGLHDLELESRPTLVGRVVDPGADSGPIHGLASTRVSLRLEFSARPAGPATKTIISSVETDGEGRFRETFEPQQLEPGLYPGSGQHLSRVSLGVAGGERIAVQLPEPDHRGGGGTVYDLGDVKCPDVHRVRVLVRDAEGTPLARARVGFEDKPESTTDAEGVALLLSGVDPPGEIITRARGFVSHRTRWNPSPANLEVPIEVTLTEAMPWTIYFDGPGGARAPEGQLILEWESVTGVVPDWRSRADRRDGAQLHSSSWESGSDGDSYTLYYRLAGQDSFEIEHVEPDTTLFVTLEDTLGIRLCGAEIPPPSATSDRTTELRWTQPEYSFAARVFDGSGESVVGAQVRLEVGPHRIDASTDSGGDVHFRGLHGSTRRGELWVDAPGHARGRVGGLRIEAGVERLEVHLEPTVPLVVRILNSMGQLTGIEGVADVEGVAPAKRQGRPGGTRRPGALPEPVRSRKSEDGSWVLEGLPLGKHRLAVLAGGRTYSMIAEVGGGEVEWSLPPLGSVSISIPESTMRGAMGDARVTAFEVDLKPATSDETGLRRFVSVPGPLQIKVDHLVPGTWTLQLRKRLRYPGGSREGVDLGEPLECTVNPGARRSIQFGR